MTISASAIWAAACSGGSVKLVVSALSGGGGGRVAVYYVDIQPFDTAVVVPAAAR